MILLGGDWLQTGFFLLLIEWLGTPFPRKRGRKTLFSNSKNSNVLNFPELDIIYLHVEKGIKQEDRLFSNQNK